MSSWFVAMLPVIGVVVGAALQHLLSRTQETRKQREVLRTAAYVDYLRGVTMTALAQQRGDEANEASGNALMADAKARMCVYGGSETLRALATFSKGGAGLATREGIDAFVSLCETMRAETGEPSIRREDLIPVLFGRPLTEFPTQHPDPTLEGSAPPEIGASAPMAALPPPQQQRRP